jgi:hypothetical protein
MAQGPAYTDAADGVNFIRVAGIFGPVCFFLLSLLWYFLLEKGFISKGVFVFLLILTLPITAAAVVVIHRTVGATAVLMMKTMFAVGDIPPPPTYPRQDVLIAQGKYAEAADWFRDHLRIEPDDHEARLRLAHLLEMHLKGFDEAERLFLQIRNAQPPAQPRQLMQACNHLIDLYRKTGKTDRLKVELARFVDRYRGSPQAEGAARELKELKALG